MWYAVKHYTTLTDCESNYIRSGSFGTSSKLYIASLVPGVICLADTKTNFCR